ncbi:MAG TPA: hypothetical protein VF275_05435 [Gammaproteobacteria bacterium]
MTTVNVSRELLESTLAQLKSDYFDPKEVVPLVRNLEQALTHPAEQPAPIPYDQHEREMDEVMIQRDSYHDKADELANAIAEYFGVDIGEHSSANCPWEQALEEIEYRGKTKAEQPSEGDVGRDVLDEVCDLFGIGSAVRTRETILANVQNAIRRSDCLWRIEHLPQFCEMVEDDDGELAQESLLCWGEEPDQYEKRAREILTTHNAQEGKGSGIR